MIEKLLTAIRNRKGKDLTIVSIFKTGGHLFCSNCKDEDYIVIVKEDGNRFVINDKENNIDYFIWSEKERNKNLSIPNKSKIEIYDTINEIMKPKTTIYGDPTNNMLLLSKEKEYKEMLRTQLKRTYLNPHISWENSDKYCHRHFWYVIVGLKFIENQSYEVNDELLNIIQQCHDGVLDKSWEEWVKQQIGYDG